MTMLNPAPTTATGPATTGSSAAGSAPRPVVIPGHQQQPSADATANAGPQPPELHLLGSASAPVGDAAKVATPQRGVVVPLDQFAKQGGPDATVQTADGPVNVHVVFQLDSKTHQVSVAIVSQDGQLIRMIPPESVSRMIAAMATYRGR
jgi:hypothetical protein